MTADTVVNQIPTKYYIFLPLPAIKIARLFFWGGGGGGGRGERRKTG